MNNQVTATPEAASLLENQRAIASTASAVGKLEGAIADYTSTVDKMRATLPEPGATERERENLLAAIAIGEKRQADLDALDSRVANQQAQTLKDSRALTGIAQTVAGLQRRLSEEQGKLQQLRQARLVLMRKFLLSEAEAEGAQYAASAVALAAHYRRLMALESLLADHGHVPSIAVHGEGLRLPGFGLESVRAHALSPLPGSGHQGAIFDLRFEPNRIVLARQEKDRLRAQGVEIE